MASGTGLQTVIGTGVETTFGTPVTPTRFHPFLSESLEREQVVLASNAIRGGGSVVQARRGARRRLTSLGATGDIQLEINTTGMGRMWEHLMGGTPTIAQQGGTAAWLQTHAWGSQQGKYLTLQKQIRDSAGTEVESFTTTGAKILAAEFRIAVGEIATVTFSIDGREVVTNVAMASPSFGAEKIFGYPDASLELAGVVPTCVTEATVRIERNLNTDHRCLGNQGRKSEQLEEDFPNITGSINAEFDAAAVTAIYDKFAADTALSFALIFQRDVIASTFYEKCQITIPEIRFTGEVPKVGGPGVVMINAPFEGQYDGTNPSASILYTSVDTAV